MKKFALLFMLGLSVLILAWASYAYEITPPSASLRIIESEISPVPAEPGRDLLLKITVENYGQSNAQNVSIEIKPGTYILLKDENERTKYIPSLCGGCKLTNTYQLHVEPRAVSGNYEMDIEAKSGAAQNFGIIKTVNISVKGEPQLSVSDVKIEPEIVTPGSNLALNLMIENKGTGVARAITVKAILNNVPLVPLGTDSSIIEELGPGASKNLSFRLLAKDSADAASYSIPVRMSYRNENGENRSSEELVGLKIFGNAKLSIASVKTDPVRVNWGDHFTLMITLENSGQGTARSIKANVDLPFGGEKTAFLGKIERDEDAPAVFNLQAGNMGSYKYSLTLEYEDDLGKHEEQQELEITVYKSESFWRNLVLAAAIIGGGYAYFIYRRRAAKKGAPAAAGKSAK